MKQWNENILYQLNHILAIKLNIFNFFGVINTFLLKVITLKEMLLSKKDIKLLYLAFKIKC